MRDVDINAFGARFRVRTEPENEPRVKRAAQLLEERVESVSTDLKRTINGRVPDIFFYAALGIAEELIIAREQVEDTEKSTLERDERLRQVVDKSLVSKFTKLRMAYGAERKGDR